MSVSNPAITDADRRAEPVDAVLHKPVLAAEAIELLTARPGGTYIDCTVGSGGHSRLIMEKIGRTGRLLGIDRDPEALARAGKRLLEYGNCYRGVHGNFADISAIAVQSGFECVDGVILDAGVSSEQLDTPERGFSFMHDGPLDMRMDPTSGPTAADLVNGRMAEDIEEIIRRYGEDRMARRIAGAIVRERAKEPFITTARLAGVVEVAAGGRRGRIHPATRTFQALRIEVNGELEALERGIEGALGLLKRGGRIAVISFHSLEDRIVKNIFKEHAGWRESLESGGSIWQGKKPAVTILTKKPVMASDREMQVNHRSRTAKLRVAERSE